jgi:peptidoglycan/xylan/chitin deacetylase (PgdA/CDA1 family)
MYHHLSDEPGASTTSPAKFKADMNELSLAGYTPVFLDDLYDFVTGDAALPAKPVVITFDDGYQSNYEYAFPVLKQHKFKAEISVIGWSIGKSQYDEGIYAGMKIIKHFSLAEAKTMVDSKLVHIESHSYAMHEYSPNGNVSRLGVLKKPGESYEDYIKAFTDDSAKMTKIISDALGYRPKVFTYPYGLYSALTEKLLESLGYSITIITESGISTVTKGDMQSLHCLKRLSMDDKTGCVTAAIENNLTKS